MNKKGDVPTLLLIIVALALSLATILGLLTFDNNRNQQSIQFSEITSDIEFKQQYITASIKLLAKQSITQTNPEQAFQDLANKKEFIYPGTENFFGKIRRHTPSTKEFTLTKNENNNYVFQMQDIKITSKKADNSITRTLNLCFEFNSNGEFLNSC